LGREKFQLTRGRANSGAPITIAHCGLSRLAAGVLVLFLARRQ
jgi:hypothetical protein